MQLVKLNIDTTNAIFEALRACGRLFAKIHKRVQRDPKCSTMPLVLVDMYGTLPLTQEALHHWLEESDYDEQTLTSRLNTCIDLLRNELRANSVLEQMDKHDRSFTPNAIRKLQ